MFDIWLWNPFLARILERRLEELETEEPSSPSQK